MLHLKSLQVLCGHFICKGYIGVLSLDMKAVSFRNEFNAYTDAIVNESNVPMLKNSRIFWVL
jgi:hypothetical protein